MRKRGLQFLFLLAMFGPVTCACAQDYYSYGSRMEFLLHAYSSGEYGTAVTEAGLIRRAFPGRGEDSLAYYSGRSLLIGVGLEAGLAELRRVSSGENDFFRFSQSALAYQDFITDEDPSLQQRVEILEAQPDKFRDYGILLIAADQLLELDTNAYRKYLDTHPVRELFVRKAFSEMNEGVQKFGNVKFKKPATAGILSAVIPGAGKCYLGKWGTGIVSFLSMGGIGLQAWEGYRKGGLKSPQFIGFTSLFALIYGANIYGSVTQAKAYNVQLISDFKNGIAIQVDLSFDRLFTR